MAANIGGAIAAAFGMLAGLGLLACGGYLLREPLRHFLNFFIGAVDKWGPWGCVAYALVYTGLEVRCARRGRGCWRARQAARAAGRRRRGGRRGGRSQ